MKEYVKDEFTIDIKKTEISFSNPDTKKRQSTTRVTASQHLKPKAQSTENTKSNERSNSAYAYFIMGLTGALNLAGKFLLFFVNQPPRNHFTSDHLAHTQPHKSSGRYEAKLFSGLAKAVTAMFESYKHGGNRPKL